MICFKCDQQAVGQCPVCWRFYCPQHGNRRCNECAYTTSGVEFIGSRIISKGPITSVEVQPLEPIRVGRLQRVIVSGDHQEYKGLIIGLVCIEVYSDGFVAIFRLTLADSTVAQHIPSPVPLLAATASDEEGTAFYASPQAAIGPIGDWHAIVRFEPSLRETSNRLSISIVRIEWLPIPPASSVITKWFGPWTFQIQI